MDDDDLDYGEDGQDDSAPTAVAPPPSNGVPPRAMPPNAPPTPNWTQIAQQLPFGQPDALRLQRYNYGLDNVLNQVSSGDLSQEEAAPAIQQLMQRIIPLSQRQQRTKAIQMQEQKQQLMDTAAGEQAVVQANAVHDAAHFHARTATQMDPATGQTAHFFMKKPGEWEQVDFGNSPQANQPSASQTTDDDASLERPPETPDEQTERPPTQAPIGPDGQPLTDQPRLRTVYDENGVARQQRIPTLAERQAMDNAPTPQAQAAIASQIGHGTFQDARPGPGGSLLVQQGPFTEQYANGRLVGTNRPQPQQTGGQTGGFTPEEIQHARNVAAAVTAGMPPGLHRDVQHGNAMRQTLLTTAHQKEIDRRTTAATQQQQAKATAAEKAKATAALEQERKESRKAAYSSVDEEYKAAVAAKGKDANATIPAQYATPEARLAEAQRIHRESWAAGHPDSQEAKDIAAGKTNSAATAPSDQDKIAALGKAAETHFNTPGQQGFLYNTGDANTAKAIVDTLTPAFHENRPLTSTERQQYDTLHKQITDPQLKDRLDWNGKLAQGAKGIASTVQRGPSGAPVYRDPKIAATVNARLKELGLGEKPKASGVVPPIIPYGSRGG